MDSGDSVVSLRRLLRSLLWFAFGVAIAFVWLVPAQAETIAATPANTPVTPASQNFRGTFANASNQTSLSAAVSQCVSTQGAAWCNVCGSTYMGWGYRHTLSSSGGCPGTYYAIDQTINCPAGSTLTAPSGAGQSATCQVAGYTCPAGQNWTLSGSTCTRPDCQYGRASDGTCTNCPAGKFMSPGVGSAPYRVVDQALTIDYQTYTGSGTSVPATTCAYGCTVSLGSEYSGAGSGSSGNWFWVGAPSFTGATCSVTPGADPVVQPNTPEADCAKAGKQWGTVNGTVICVDAGTTSTKKTSVVTGPGGGSTATTQTQTCTGGSCNSTTTVTNTGGGASGTATNGTTTSTSTATGSQTQGDGVSACRDDPYGPACLGAPASGGGAGSETQSGSGVSAVAMPGESLGCPAPVQILQWQIPFDGACQLAGYLRPLVLALAWLGAGLFVVGGIRNG